MGVLVLVSALVGASSASATAIGPYKFGDPCPNVIVIGARGSGQERDGSGKFTENSATLGLGQEIFTFYEQLGVAVGSQSVAALANPYAAVGISEYASYDIFKSLDEGRTNTRVLVAGVAAACPGTRIVLAGYSQGAWASKEGAEFVKTDNQSHVAALVLLADPTFDPHGGGSMFGTFDPHKGGLAARSAPPDWIKANTFSLCLANDLVCQTDGVLDLLKNLAAFGTLVHTKDYQNPHVLRLVANAVASRFTGSAVDLVFAIDTTGSMGPYIDGVKAAATDIVHALLSTGDARISLVDYKDFYACPSDGHAARTDLAFTTDLPTIQAAINGLTPDGGCDAPESVYSGLIQAIQSPWRTGVKKEIVLMGDAPPHDPEPVTGYTLASVVAAARAVDPAVINTIDIFGGGSPFFDELTAETGGGHFLVTSPSDAIEAILKDVEAIGSAPVADAGGPYTATVGESVLFDASGSFSPTGGLTSYEWDFNGDSVYDETTTAPATTHIYAGAYEGPASVRVTDDQTPSQSAVGTTAIVVSAAKQPTSITTQLQGAGQLGPTVIVPSGTPVFDVATLSGANAAAATGTVTYNIYSDSACTNLVASAGAVTVTDGVVSGSATETFSTGTYYWRASYGGDTTNEAADGVCGDEIETVEGEPCSTVRGSANIVTRGEGAVQRQKVTNRLSTSLASKQSMKFRWGVPAHKLTLTRLASATCTSTARSMKFSGEGEAMLDGTSGMHVKFSFQLSSSHSFAFHLVATRSGAKKMAFTARARALSSESIH